MGLMNPGSGEDRPIIASASCQLCIRGLGCDSRLDDDIVKSITKTLILSARRASLDMHEGTTLPELALLALLQHHGAATPLLDVSLDPVVGLYMSVVSPSTKDDDEDGALFAIRKPTTTIAPFDSRRFATVYDSLPRDRVIFYSAPDISERLRIQRGTS